MTYAALLTVARDPSSKVGPLTYDFVLNLSEAPSPFDLPEDVSSMTHIRPSNAIAALLAPARSAGASLPIADDGVHERRACSFHARSRENRRIQNRLLFVVSADHATADPLLWVEPTNDAMAKIPLFIYLPAALIASFEGSFTRRERVSCTGHALL
jgi:hypothetical protein